MFQIALLRLSAASVSSPFDFLFCVDSSRAHFLLHVLLWPLKSFSKQAFRQLVSQLTNLAEQKLRTLARIANANRRIRSFANSPI
jgi:hypothetical protein